MQEIEQTIPIIRRILLLAGILLWVLMIGQISSQAWSKEAVRGKIDDSSKITNLKTF